MLEFYRGYSINTLLTCPSCQGLPLNCYDVCGPQKHLERKMGVGYEDTQSLEPGAFLANLTEQGPQGSTEGSVSTALACCSGTVEPHITRLSAV